MLTLSLKVHSLLSQFVCVFLYNYSVHHIMSDITEALAALAVSRLTKGDILVHLLERLGDAFIMVSAFALLVMSLVAYSIYLLFMRRQSCRPCLTMFTIKTLGKGEGAYYKHLL